VLIRDVLVQDYSICNSFTIFQYCRAKELLKIDACLYLSNNYHSYYGSNFSGFYVSWRTGKIGLVALDGRGSFQGKIDEEWLRAKGFEKKEI